MLWKNLMEEIFFFQYHMQMDRFRSMKLEIHERKYMINKFVEQKNKEKEEMDKQNRKASRRR
jgi:hypothetical protein